MYDYSLILLCAGNSSRSELNKNKTLYQIDSKPVFLHSLETFINLNFKNIIIAIKEEEKTEFEKYVSKYKNININFVKGGLSRQESVKNALNKVNTKYVLIHDAARAFVHKEDIMQLIDALKIHPACTLAKRCTDTIAKTKDENINSYINRNEIILIQTPQGFLTSKLKEAYAKVDNLADFTDDTNIFLKYSNDKVFYCISKHNNEKLTYKKDFIQNKIKYGIGFDMHRLVENRDLILGGIKIPHDKGLLGHSDADSLIHSIIDALLSAAGLDDIGHQFPDTDQQYKNINSMILLNKTQNLINKNGYIISNIAAEILCEKPKLAKFIPLMEENIANCLNISKEKIKISATTLEGLGFIGREEGIGANSVACIEKII